MDYQESCLIQKTDTGYRISGMPDFDTVHTLSYDGGVWACTCDQFAQRPEESCWHLSQLHRHLKQEMENRRANLADREELVRRLLPWELSEETNQFILKDKRTGQIFRIAKIRNRFAGRCSCAKASPGVQCIHQLHIRRILFDRWYFGKR